MLFVDMKLIYLILLLVDISFCQSESRPNKSSIISYDRYSLYSTTPTEVHHLKFLKSLETQKYIDVIYWKRPVKLYYEVQFLLPPSDVEMFMERATHFRLPVTKMIDDIQEAFDNQTIRRYIRLKDNSFNWENYHSIEDVYQWLADTVLKYPGKTELTSIGRTHEGRDIYVLAIKNAGSAKKVFIEGGIHGNEWISVEFVTYLIDRLLNTDKYKELQYVAMAYNWFLIPILNPDGFDYSHTTDRLWRKNRKPLGQTYGVDLDRNFNYNFGAFSSSSNPKDDEYCGPSPFSEAETKALRSFLKENYKGLRFYFSFHAYGQKIVLPYGDRVKHVEDFSEMENYGKQAIIQMYRATGVKYSIGTFYDTMDMFLWNHGFIQDSFCFGRYVMSFLLRDNGKYGHALPPDQIQTACREALIGLDNVMRAQPRYVQHNLFSSIATRNMLSSYAFTIVTLIVFK